MLHRPVGLDPLTGATVHLPQITEPPVGSRRLNPNRCDYYLNNVILSADPSTGCHYMVAAIYDERGKVVLLISGDPAWTKTNLKAIKDVTYHKGRVYAADNDNQVVCFDVRSAHAQTMIRAWCKNWWNIMANHETYLVETENGLLFRVARRYQFEEVGDDDTYEYWVRAFGFMVQRLLSDKEGKPGWVDVKDLAGHAFFLGNNHSMALVASEFPGICKSDSIYFTDNQHVVGGPYRHGHFDIGVYNLGSDKLETPDYVLDPAQKQMPPAVWIALVQAPASSISKF